MTLLRICKAAAVVSAAATITFVSMNVRPTKAHAQQPQQDTDQYLASVGLQIAPSFINSAGKDLTLVGLGSFIVNASADCNGCHGSDPANEFLPAGNPYFLSSKDPLFTPAAPVPMQFNPATYLSGGQNFGPAGPGVVSDPTSPLFGGPGAAPNTIARNLTPDYTGNPAGGIDLPTFISILRTGHDYDNLHPNCGTYETNLATYVTYSDNCYNAPVNGTLLQVMPWVKFRNMTDYQLTAIWTYLSTVPCNAHNDTLGTTFPWLQNACTAPASKSLHASASTPRVELRRMVRR